MSSSQSGPIHQTAPAFGPGGGNGVTPAFTLSRQNFVSQGDYLLAGDVPTSITGLPIKGINTIVDIDITNGTSVDMDNTFQLSSRTGLASFVDIPGATVTLTTGNFEATAAFLTIDIGPDEEVSAYLKTGQTAGVGRCRDVVLSIYCIPR